MAPRLIVLALCLAANALLATILFRHDSSPASQNFSAKKNPASTFVVLSNNQSGVAKNPVVTSEFSPANFQWTQLLAPDFAAYIKNLRAFGTPEQKVRDIIFGAVEAIYRPRRAQFQPKPKADDGKFWEHRFFFGSQSTKEQREQMRALTKEEADLLKSLLGDDVYEKMQNDSGNPDWEEQQLGFIPKNLREKVEDINEQMNEDKQQIYARSQGYMDQYAQSDLRKIEKKYHDQLAAILSPDQLLEWDMRNSDTANQLKNNLSAFDPTEDEFRALFKYQQTADDLSGQLNPQQLDPDADQATLSADQKQAISDEQKTLNDDLAQALGTNRAAEYKLEQDYSYRNLIDSGVPKESVFKLDEMKMDAQAAANKIRSDKTLSADDRAAALSAIRTETQSSINDLLGAKAAKIYNGNGGWWLNNIAPANK